MATHQCNWMQQHLPFIGHRKLSEICLPSSHNSGMDVVGWGTQGGTKSNVLCQTTSILDQLRVGVRHFDIRPTLASQSPDQVPGEWACGHYTDTDTAGWQGANGRLIREVVEDVNRYTDENKEVVLLWIKNIHRIEIGALGMTGARGEVNTDQWKQLFNVLKNLRHRFTLHDAEQIRVKKTESANNANIKIQDFTLNELLGRNEAAVIVLFDTNPVGEQIYADGFWELSKHKFEHEEWGTVMQSTLDAVLSTTHPLQNILPGGAPTSVLNLTKDHQARYYPWVLQKLALLGGADMIGMDNNKDGNLVTICLAVTYQAMQPHTSSSPDEPQNLVVVYGDKLIVDEGVKASIAQHIRDGKGFDVRNENLGGDSWPGMVKALAVYYQHDGVIKGRLAKEGGRMHLEEDIISITYGGVRIRNQQAYNALLMPLRDSGGFTISNETLGGDPVPGQKKQMKLAYCRLNSKKEEWEASEGDYFNFKTWLEKIGEAASHSHFH